MRPLLIDATESAPPGSEERGALLRGLAFAALIVLATRLLVWTAAYCGAFTHARIEADVGPPLSRHTERLREARSDPESAWSTALDRSVADLAPLLKWDAGHYRSIAERGYQYTPPAPDASPRDAQSNIAFFPLYPLTCRMLAPLIGVAGAQVVIANTAALLAAMLIFVWFRRRVGDEPALCGMACVFCWPAACFYSFGYAESTTLLLIVGTLWLADSERFVLATIACAFATATRPTAAGLVVVLMLTYWMRVRATGARRWRPLIVLTIGAAGGIVLYAAYLTHSFGSPMVYFSNFRDGWQGGVDADRDWFALATFARVWDQFKYFGRAFVEFPQNIAVLARPLTWNMPATLAVLFLSLAGMARVSRDFRPFLLLAPLIFIQTHLAAGWTNYGVEPLARYTAVAAPAFVVCGVWIAKEWPIGARVAFFAIALLLQASWAFHFGLGDWTG